jgi:hypothetical protein
MGPTVRETRAALAVAAREARRHPGDPVHLHAVDERRREHREARAEQRIRELINDALSDETRNRLADLLRTAGAA